MTDKFGLRSAKGPRTSDSPPPADLSDFQPGEPHTPDPDSEARMDRRAADMGFPPRGGSDDIAPGYREQGGHRRRPPKEPATQLTLHIPVRVAKRFANWCDDNELRSYWRGLERLMDNADVPK